jgi:DNA polymerase bacteriophage-type
MQVMTYDIVDAGPRNRFTVNGRIVHNCTGNGPQPTNLPNSGPEVKRCACDRHHGKTLPFCPWCGAYADGEVVEWNAAATEDALEVIATRSLAAVTYFFGEGLPIISACLRGLFVSAPGKDLICSDYSSIEAVVLAEIAGESWRREVFQTHGRIYEISAAKITGIPFDEAVRHPRRKLGKVAELASGYQGWIGGWKAFGADEFLTDEEIKQAILAWRAASPGIVELWGGQERNWVPERYGCEGAAINAIQYPCVPYHVLQLNGTYAGITFQSQHDVLYCRLPSGRCLTYHRPRLRESERRPGTLAMSYEGQNTNPKNGPVGWIRMDTWGGRLVENCIAEGTEVLTRRGWVFIESVRPDDLVHDGLDFVPHGGLLFKSVQPCIQVDGVWMTDDHEVLANDGSWRAAKTKPRPFRPEVWNADGDGADGRKEPKAAVAVFVRVREFLRTGRNRSNQVRQEWANAKLRLRGSPLAFPKNEDARYEPPPSLRRMEINERPLPLTVTRRLEELRRSGDKGLRRMANVFRGFLAGHGANVLSGLGLGPGRQQRALLQGELSVDVASTKHNEPTRFYPHGRRAETIGSDRNFTINSVLPAGERMAGRRPDEAPRLDKQVFDILNCGPRHRFVVRGESGPFIVHNCVQATARDILRRATIALEQSGYPVVLHVYDEIVSEVPEWFGSIEEFERIMGTMPEFAADWPVRAQGGWRGKRYRK